MVSKYFDEYQDSNFGEFGIISIAYLIEFVSIIILFVYGEILWVY